VAKRKLFGVYKTMKLEYLPFPIPLTEKILNYLGEQKFREVYEIIGEINQIIEKEKERLNKSE
jgi:hypothetical protein